MNTSDNTPIGDAHEASPESGGSTAPAGGNRPRTLRDLAPWEGRPSGGDKLLLFMIFAVPAFYMLTYPARPFLIAEHPLLLQLLVGSKTATGAAAAYASVGQLSLPLVLIAGVVGMAKFDWLFWLAGRKWGLRMVELLTGDSANKQKWADRLDRLPRWLWPLLVVISRLPGLPGPLIWVAAGMHQMRLWMFLVCDLVACALMVGIVAAAGYASGEHGVALIQKIDSYAMWVSIALVVALAGWQQRQSSKGASTSTARD